MGKVFLTVRVPALEMDILKRYCSFNDRNQTDVIREFIRSLESKLQSEAATKEH